jgi:hypothetical protein
MRIRLTVLRVCAVLALGLVITGCGRPVHRLQVPADLEIPAQSTEKIQQRVGLYIPSRFAAYGCTVTSTKGDEYCFALGDAFVSGAEAVANMAFQETVPISEMGEAGYYDIDIIIYPEIEAVDMVIPPWFHSIQRALVIVKWTAIDSTGRVKWVDTFKGWGENEVAGFPGHDKSVRECIESAIEDVFSETLQGILGSSWWRSTGRPLSAE